MNTLLNFITPFSDFSETDLEQIQNVFEPEEFPAKTIFLKAGNVERYLYFLSSGIVKGYKNLNGKLIIEHLPCEENFFAAFDSFNSETPSVFTFETITACKVLKITKPNLQLLGKTVSGWNKMVERVTNEYLSCKMERIGDFQTLSAKERYLKFVSENPNQALNVSVDNIASFLGIEPPSLSRIRKQIALK